MRTFLLCPLAHMTRSIAYPRGRASVVLPTSGSSPLSPYTVQPGTLQSAVSRARLGLRTRRRLCAPV
jgi:hypothetical protein